MGRQKLNRFRFAFKPNMTKAEEIEALKELLEAIPKDSYLYLMFKNLDKYCIPEIENDFGMNIAEIILKDPYTELTRLKEQYSVAQAELKEIHDSWKVMDALVESNRPAEGAS